MLIYYMVRVFPRSAVHHRPTSGGQLWQDGPAWQTACEAENTR